MKMKIARQNTTRSRKSARILVGSIIGLLSAASVQATEVGSLGGTLATPDIIAACFHRSG